jgi:hypothetical protein
VIVSLTGGVARADSVPLLDPVAVANDDDDDDDDDDDGSEHDPRVTPNATTSASPPPRRATDFDLRLPVIVPSR